VKHLRGIGASPGIAIGPAFIFQKVEIRVERRDASNAAREWARIEEGLKAAVAQLEALARRVHGEIGSEQAAIFEAQLQMLDDPDLLDAVRHLITDRHISAEYALQMAGEEFAQRLADLDDEYLAARAADVRDAIARVVRILLGVDDSAMTGPTEPSVIVAADLTPSDTAGLDRSKVLGFCTASGGATSHTAILARGLGLPAVVGAGEAIQSVPSRADLILDGDEGVVVVAPDDATRRVYRDRQAHVATRLAGARAQAQSPATTADGHRVEVAANIGDVASAQAALEWGAEGVGLLRTEFLFLERATLPTEEEQYAAYRAITDVMGQRPLIIRTLDIGGDKQVPYLGLAQELNPFLGWRAIRLCLAQPEVFQVQLRAILRAGHERNVRVMFPMIADVEEVRRCKLMLREAMAALDREQVPFARDMSVGIMVEIPAAAVAADILATEADFFSIGTNDLIQYSMACDRTNERVSYLYQPFHPAILRLIRQVIGAAHKAGKWVGMCGEMAGEPLAIPLLLGLGLDEFSMSPSAIPEAKRIIGSLSRDRARKFAARTMRLPTAAEIQTEAERFLDTLATPNDVPAVSVSALSSKHGRSRPRPSAGDRKR